MMLDALRTRAGAAIFAIALLATLTGSLLWFARSRHEPTVRTVSWRVAFEAPPPVPWLVFVPHAVDPYMPVLAPAVEIDRMAIAAPASGDLGILAPRAAVEVVAPRALWTDLVVAGAPLWFANVADDALASLIGPPAIANT